jgi:PAS domain S-box-containing protein
MDSKGTTLQLWEALDYAKNIISTIREPLIVLDANLRIISSNQSFYRTFLTSPEKTEGKLIYEVANRQWDIPKLRELLENILPNNTSFENYVVEHDFSELGRRVMLLNARRIHDGGFKTQKILLAIEDITERTQMEREKASSELRYRRLFETAQDGILILGGVTGEINDVNPFLLKMLGYSRQELLGKKLWEIGFFKDTNASHNAFQTLQEKGYVRYEDLPLETKDGRPMEVEFVSNVYAIDGETVIQCNIRDITDRNKTEAQLVYLASFTELNPNPILELDIAGDLKYLNPAAKACFPDLSKLKLNHPFLIDWESFAQTLLSGKSPSITRDIKVGDYWYQQALTYVPSSKSYRLFARNITDRINTTEELRKRTKELEASNKELESFSYSVSHDLRTPLRSIAGFSAALLEDYSEKLDDEGKQYLEHIQDSSELMAQLIDDLLKLSRVTRTDINLDKTVFQQRSDWQ